MIVISLTPVAAAWVAAAVGAACSAVGAAVGSAGAWVAPQAVIMATMAKRANRAYSFPFMIKLLLCYSVKQIWRSFQKMCLVSALSLTITSLHVTQSVDRLLLNSGCMGTRDLMGYSHSTH